MVSLDTQNSLFNSSQVLPEINTKEKKLIWKKKVGMKKQWQAKKPETKRYVLHLNKY